MRPTLPCPECNGPVTHARTGNKRTYCSAICRRRFRVKRDGPAAVVRKEARKAEIRASIGCDAWLKAKFANKRSHVRKSGVALTLSSWRELPRLTDNCPCCLSPWSLGARGRPELDRIIPSSGYSAGNLQWICGACNTRKQDQSPEDLYEFAVRMLAATAAFRAA